MMSKELSQIISQRLERQQQTEKIFDRLSEIAKKACFYDWMYINQLNPYEINELAELIKNSNNIGIDLFFENHFAANIDKFKKLLIKKNTKRETIVSQIFYGIEKQLFYLVIPTIISQIEGITEDKTGIRFFGTRNNEPKLKQILASKEIKYFQQMLLHPVDTVWEYSRNQDSGNPSKVNRHDIVHGVSVDYGEKVICYKYLSVLLFVTENLDKLD